MKRRTLLLGGWAACMGRKAAKEVPETGYVATGGLTFPVLSWGPQGTRPILLLHGFPQEPSIWTPIAEALVAEGLRVFAPWARGYVFSNRPKGPDGYTFTWFADDVIGIADGLGLRQLDVVGFGIGGAQAWMVAAFHPERVRSVASIRYPHPAAFAEAMRSDPQQKQKWEALQQQLGAGSPVQQAARLLADHAAGLRRFLLSTALPRSYFESYFARLQEPGVLAAALSWNSAVSLEEFSHVPHVLVPSLLIWSEGPALAQAAAEATRKYVRARFMEVSVPGGHFLLETAPEVLLGPLLKHLRSS